MERVMGIEPTLAAWEAAVLPLNYTRSPGLLRSAQCEGTPGLLKSPGEKSSARGARREPGSLHRLAVGRYGLVKRFRDGDSPGS